MSRSSNSIRSFGHWDEILPRGHREFQIFRPDPCDQVAYETTRKQTRFARFGKKFRVSRNQALFFDSGIWLGFAGKPSRAIRFLNDFPIGMLV
ncbi:unnamed protein product [Tuwongella immobilis]|uniref:Uncharacterized protein n=1 Tax=Tuwongella immobilis TaxID=692036 RepID=A0A6C2YSU6_9BACT|nr:unnamed protein product [Tuwongella immobilis]VTS06413.1 unnamed protein product [Tuwongella immobilis]